MITAGPWISDAPGNAVMAPPNHTRVSLSQSSPYELKMPLGAGVPLTTLPANEVIRAFFQLRVPPTGFSGSLHQDVTINLLC